MNLQVINVHLTELSQNAQPCSHHPHQKSKSKTPEVLVPSPNHYSHSPEQRSTLTSHSRDQFKLKETSKKRIIQHLSQHLLGWLT